MNCNCESCKPSQPYNRKVLDLKSRPELKRTIEAVYDFLLETMCRFPRDDYERRDVDKNTVTLLPTDFPYQWNLLKSDSYDRPITENFEGPVYWNDFHREVFSGLKPFKVHPGGGESFLTVRGLCERISQTGFSPEQSNTLQSIHVQMREEEDREAMTIIFVC